MSKTKLYIRLAKFLEGETIGKGTGVVTNIYATEKGAGSNGLRDILIPVTDRDDVYRTVELEPGSYLIESVLPSGEIVSEEILLKPDQPLRVALHAESSPREWLSWQKLSGNINRQNFASTEAGYERVASVEDDALAKGLAEIGKGVFREQAFTAVAQWRTLEQMIGRDAGDSLEQMKQRTQSARSGSQADGFSWTTCDIYESWTQVFQLKPGSGAGKARIRDFLYWTSAGAELIRLPNHWVSLDDFDEKLMEVMIDLSHSGRKFRSAVAVKDPSFATALAYLTAGSLPQARLLVGRALEGLYHKRSNPYAAAAGAYLLLIADKPTADDNWPGWIGNLYNRYDWLPDGAVLHAWLMLMLGDSQAAKTSLKEAYQRGIPLYSAGIKRLLDGLTLFSAEDRECAQMERSVRTIAWRTNMDQYFTIVRLGSK